MSVNIRYGITLATLIISVIILSYIIEKIAKYFRINLYSLSFDEGSHNYILEISSEQSIDYLKNSEHIIQYVYSRKSSIRHYRLVSNNYDDLQPILKLCENDSRVLDVEINRP